MAAMSRRSSRQTDDPEAPAATRSARRRLLRWTGWFGVANTLVLILVSSRNLAVTDMAGGLLPRVFAVLMFLGHCALIAFLPSLLLLPLILLRLRAAVVLPLATVSAVVLVGVTLVDTVIYQQYRFHLNAEIFNLLFGGAAGEILVFSATMYLQAALALLVIVVGQTLLARLLWRRIGAARGGRYGYVVSALLVSAFVAQGLIHAWADVAGYTPITRQRRVLLAYLPLTAEQFFAKLGLDIERADAALLARDRGSNLSYPLRPLTCDAPSEQFNLLFVVIDSWRRDALTETVTPNVARLAERSLRFGDHLSGGSATRSGIFSLFYAIPATYWHAMLAEQRGPVFVAELLRQGYEVGIFASSSLINPEFDRTVFSDVADLRLRSDGNSSSERDEDLTRDFLDFLDRRPHDRPFFSVLFYDAPHAYDVPEEFPQPFQPSWDDVNFLALHNDFDPVPFHNRYLNCVRYDDALVGQVLEALERGNLLENTVIVITGDHGQEFNENRLNYWGHDSNFSRYQLAVPLILYWPGRDPATHAHRTSHFDVVPTLMDDLLGCTNQHADYSVGQHVLEPGGRDALLMANYTDYAIVQPDRTVAVYPYGVEVLDATYRPIEGASPDSAVTLEALRLRGRFYK
jgi:membrane-anchored protein YejM (alkaline phosphatase superfamily)